MKQPIKEKTKAQPQVVLGCFLNILAPSISKHRVMYATTVLAIVFVVLAVLSAFHYQAHILVKLSFMAGAVISIQIASSIADVIMKEKK